ncbi:hypothetical protein RHMOL_Rhmol12G0010400 [Rhododendron molle]|uniref:Uncharacterized protein n=1 Tax=Rhododendron molle TaxID=49168 RepID=A0ACC0LCZ5_RHOML|nr:hypothetical protein RHMOL_Rhmol12G0010400 [Rhododendron molle]
MTSYFPKYARLKKDNESEYIGSLKFSLAANAFPLPESQWRLSKLEMLKRRGKGPPKKGQGKRSKRK